jgi:pyruvate formate-lyase activating enzyme-like uncharacterized protein
MKTTLIFGLVLIAPLVSTSINAHSNFKRIVKTDSSAESHFCAAILKDKPLLIRKRLRETHSTKSNAINTILCNGLTVAEFAHKHNATKAIANLGLSDSQNQIASTTIN